MRHFARVFAALAALLFFTAAAQAAPTCTRFWVGGGSSTAWTATGNTNWSTTSNGANNASVPTTTDVVCFDSHSGSATSNISASITVLDADFTGSATGASGSYAGTLTQASSTTLTIGGNFFELTSGMTYSPSADTQALSFTDATASDTIVFKSAGHLLGNVTIDPVATTTFQFQAGDPLTLRSASNAGGVLTLTQGILDDSTNNVNVTAYSFSSNNTNTRTVNLGTGTWTLGNSFDLGTVSTGLTCTGVGNATIVFNGTLAGAFQSQGCSFGSVSVTCTATVTPGWIIAGTFTVGTFTVTPGNLYIFLDAGNLTITNPIAWAGTPGSSGLQILSFGQNPTAKLNLAAGSTISWAAIERIDFTGGSAPTVTNSFNIGASTGVTITGPGTGGGGGIIGG